MSKFSWTRDTFKIIDWKIIETYLTSLPLTQKVQYVKFLHKWRPTQKKLFHSNPERCSSPECTLCGFPKDNDDHIFHCTHPIMREAQIEALNTLCQDLHHLHIFPPLTEAMINYLKSWMREVPPPF